MALRYLACGRCDDGVLPPGGKRRIRYASPRAQHGRCLVDARAVHV